MPIPTSSMYQNPANQNPRRQQARQLWAEFRMYAMKARQGMHDRRNMALQDAHREWQSRPGRSTQEREKQRNTITKLHEKQYFMEMREEWQRILHSNGLRHEDWGEVTAQEMAVIRQILGPDDIEDEEEEESSGGHGAESQHLPPPDFVPTNITPQPLSQSVSHQSQASFSSHSSFSSNNQSYSAPSLASRSQNSSSASYAFVDPRKFTDDERDDFPASPFLGRRGAAFTLPSEDEDNGIPIPNYKTWAAHGQQQSSGFPPPRPRSSNPSSLSSSPVDAPTSRFHNPLTSSLSSSQFPPHIPSSLSKSVAIEDDGDRIFTSAMKGVSSSSAAAAKSKAKLRSGYIGPQLTTNDSESEADADLANMQKADQAAAYERFKRDVRIRKIQEFHDEAARLDIEVVEKIYRISDTSLDLTGHVEGSNGYDKTWVARIIAQHDQDMSKLRARKEEERKRLVDDERTRMMAEIKKGRSKGPSAAGTTRKGWGTSTSMKDTAKAINAKVSAPTISSPFSTTNKTPVIPTHKPKTPAASMPGTRTDHMNLDELQNVLQTAPDMDFDTAFQITQLLQSEGTGDFDLGSEHDQNWSTPQPRHKPSTTFPTANTQGPRKRTDSVSVLDESRFGTISGKGKQRRGTITPSSVTAANDSSTNTNGFWKPQPQSSSPEQYEDPYENLFSSGNPPLRTSASKAAMNQADNADDWVGWGSKPTATTKASGGVKTTSASNSASGSAWTTKKPTQNNPTSSPTVTPASGWGASLKNTFGFGNSGWGEQRGQQGRGQEYPEEANEGEGEEAEEEISHPSLFNGQGAQRKQSSLLSDMMTKGKHAVAGAVGAALGPVNAPPSPVPSQARKKTAQVNAVPASPPVSTSTAGKKALKKGRQVANKRGTTNPEEESQEPEPQPQPTTPRASASSTKFISSLGSPNTTGTFAFGSPSSRNAAPSTGMWDDIISTTPRPGGSSSVAGGHVRKPSGLHHQVWNADGEEDQEQEEEKREEEQEEEREEDEGGDDEWNMPGSLKVRGTVGARGGAGKFGSGTTSNAKAPAKKAAAQSTSAWGPSPASKTKPAPSTATNSKRKGSLSVKHPVTMEEIPDESDHFLHRNPSNFLASDSRIILEPKPSKPPVAFEDIIQFNGESSSPEAMRQYPMSAKQRTSASANNNQEEEEVFDQSWFQKATMQLQQGTEEGNKLFGSSPDTSRAVPLAKGTNGLGTKSHPWGTPSSHSTANMAESFEDSPPLTGSAPKLSSSTLGNNTKAPKLSAWGSGLSSNQQVGAGKGASGKAKATTGTSSGLGAGGFGWGASASTHGFDVDNGPDQENDLWGGSSLAEDPWKEGKSEEELEREKSLLDARKRMQDLFGDTTSSNAKPAAKAAAGAGLSAATKAKLLREERALEERAKQEREAQEQEERAIQEREEREAQELGTQEKVIRDNEPKEKETPAAKTAGTKTVNVKRGKKKR